jgi:Zn-dependent peptidase ImmA (M78 family)/DNA-binding XRE family transcriptional regulator
MPLHHHQGARLGQRLKAARQRANLTQRQLAEALGFEHRQTLGSIEAGERRLTAEELLRAVAILGVDLDYFTDSFRLVGEGRFSFRAQPNVAASVLEEFEDLAARWIATYRELGAQQGEELQWLEHKLALTPHSAFEDAQAAAEDLAKRWQLGDQPAESLRPAMERHLQSLVLYVDAPAGISGAASQVPGLNTVLVNRREPERRRNFDLAHELFHLLTWDVMPPKHIETTDAPRTGKVSRVEHLADNFAAALLMPEAAMRLRWEARDTTVDLHDWLNRTARDLHVSAVACKWRLRNLDLLSRGDVAQIRDEALVDRGGAPNTLPRLFSAAFMQRVAKALEDGRLSVKRAAALLKLSLHGLAQLLKDYDYQPSFEA